MTAAEGVTGAGTATVTFEVPTSAPDTLYYVCQYHPAMNGTINNIDSDNIVNDANVPASGVSSTHANNGVWEVYYDDVGASANTEGLPIGVVTIWWRTSGTKPRRSRSAGGKLASVSGSNVTAVVGTPTT